MIIGDKIGDTTTTSPYPPIISHFQMRSDPGCGDGAGSRIYAGSWRSGCSGVGCCPRQITGGLGTRGDRVRAPTTTPTSTHTPAAPREAEGPAAAWNPEPPGGGRCDPVEGRDRGRVWLWGGVVTHWLQIAVAVAVLLLSAVASG